MAIGNNRAVLDTSRQEVVIFTILRARRKRLKYVQLDRPRAGSVAGGNLFLVFPKITLVSLRSSWGRFQPTGKRRRSLTRKLFD